MGNNLSHSNCSEACVLRPSGLKETYSICCPSVQTRYRNPDK